MIFHKTLPSRLSWVLVRVGAGQQVMLCGDEGETPVARDDLRLR